jgi:hypothetical protein
VALDRGEDLTKSAFAWATNGAQLRQYRACDRDFGFLERMLGPDQHRSEAGRPLSISQINRGRPTGQSRIRTGCPVVQ